MVVTCVMARVDPGTASLVRFSRVGKTMRITQKRRPFFLLTQKNGKKPNLQIFLGANFEELTAGCLVFQKNKSMKLYGVWRRYCWWKKSSSPVEVGNSSHYFLGFFTSGGSPDFFHQQYHLCTLLSPANPPSWWNFWFEFQPEIGDDSSSVHLSAICQAGLCKVERVDHQT